jgi:ABC-type ATPase with predicted acetyltransferase domain
MNGPTLDDFAQQTAVDILQRHAPDCLNRPALRDAIARLARQGIEGHVQLFQMLHQQAEGPPFMPVVEDRPPRLF